MLADYAQTARGAMRELTRLLARNQVVIVVHDAVFGVLMGCVAVALVLAGFDNGRIGAGQAFTGILLVVLLQEPMGRIGRTFYVALGGRARRDQLEELTADVSTTESTGTRRTPAHDTPPSIELRGLGVDRAGRPVLEGVDLALPAGARIALVGPSGAGKSTLLRVLGGLEEPARGRIHLDGAPADAAVRRRRCATLGQHIDLLSSTLEDNLRLVAPDADGSRLTEALHTAGLAPDLRTMPAGERTVVGEGGALLSGGQRRRLGLARLLIQDRGLVLLDEPTADLDRATERLVRERLAVSLQGRTVVETSHRLHTTLDADLVVVLVAGAVVDVGPPDQVRSRPGYYAGGARRGDRRRPPPPRRSRPMTQRNRPMTDLRWLLAFAAPARGVLAVSVLARLLGHTASAAALALPAWAIGAALTQPGDLSVLVVVAGLIVLALAAGALRYLEQLTGHLAAFRLLGELRIWVMHRVLPQAPAVIDVRGAARVLDVAVRDVDRIEVFFAHTIAPAISAVLLPAAAIGFTAATAGPPTALSLALVLAAGWAVSLLGRGAGRQTARVLGRARGDITQHVADSLRVRDVIQGAGTLEERLAAMRELDARLGAALTARSRRAGVRHGATALRGLGRDAARAARRPRDSTRSAAGRAPGGRAGAGHRDRTGHPRAARRVPPRRSRGDAARAGARRGLPARAGTV